MIIVQQKMKFLIVEPSSQALQSHKKTQMPNCKNILQKLQTLLKELNPVLKIDFAHV
jgi:hypothetical protein